MSTKRSTFFKILSDSKVLILNFSTFRMTKSVEVYDSANNDWKFLNKSMKNRFKRDFG